VARIALEVEETKPLSGIQILPVSIAYSDPYPRWRSSVTVKIGEAIEVKDFYKGSIKRDTVRLTHELSDRLKALHETTNA
jgi:1-acyl-sn-glycerol-3-phosphate acyltransferase